MCYLFFIYNFKKRYSHVLTHANINLIVMYQAYDLNLIREHTEDSKI